MASGVIEQLLDFNQGELYPKISDVNESYVGISGGNGASGFVGDLMAAGAFNPEMFEFASNKISLKSGAVIPGTINNAATADKLKHKLIIKTAESDTTGFDGSEDITINKVYQADKITKEFKIRIPDANNTATYKTVGTDAATIDKVYSAVFTDKLATEFRIRVADSNDGAVYKTVGTDRADIEKIYSAVKADSADEIKGSLKITYTDISGTVQTLVNAWKGSTDIIDANITGISEAQYARKIKNGTVVVKGSNGDIASLMTVSGASSTEGQISVIPNPSMTSDKVLLCINRSGSAGNYSYNYGWVDGTQVGGAQVRQSLADTPYYVLGATAVNAVEVHANFSGSSPYFKNSNLYQTSDETLKTFTEDLDVNLDNLASIKKGLFYWNSDENKVLDIGITAQSLEPLFPELVTETDGIKAVSYSKLSVVALAAIDKLYQRVKELEDEVEELKSK